MTQNDGITSPLKMLWRPRFADPLLGASTEPIRIGASDEG